MSFIRITDYHPFIVVEVGHRHENMNLLPRKAQVLLEQRTSIQYLLLMNTFLINGIVSYIRI